MKQNIDPNLKKVNYKGHILTLYPVSWLARFSKRTSSAIKNLSWRGYLPEPLFKVSRYRYYTAAEIMAYSDQLKKVQWKRKEIFLKLSKRLFNIKEKLKLQLQGDPSSFTKQLICEKTVIARQTKLKPKVENEKEEN